MKGCRSCVSGGEGEEPKDVITEGLWDGSIA